MRKTPNYGLPRPLARAGLFLSLLLAASTALAADEPVNNGNVFELDNNALDASSPAGDDWESIAGTGNSATRFTFVTDPVNLSTDDNFFGGGSKDERDISSAGITKTYWGNELTTPPDKNDLEHAFAAAYDINGQLVIYFGADRYSNSGDSAIGFWFFKSDVSDNADGTFTGKHTVGDVLITSDFKQGGSASVINVFEWIGNAAGGPLRLVASSASPGAGSTVDPVSKLFCINGGLVCAVANPAPVDVPTSWGGFTFKGAGSVTSFPQGTFFEGGVNISALFPNGGTCFASFMAMTRTSASTTAQLKDYVLGSFPLCGISVTKACQINDFSPVVNADGVSINTRFAIPVTNTGSGPVYDVAIEEDITLDADPVDSDVTSCKVISPTPLNGASVILATDTPKALWTSIAAGATETAIIECDSLDNALANAVTARAKSSQTASTRDLDDDYTAGEGGEGELCPVQVSPVLSVNKECDKRNANAPEGVSLAGADGFKVCVIVTVKNEGSELLEDVSVSDDMAGELLTGGSILPGATKTFGTVAEPLCYTTTAADGNETNPGEAVFKDRVDVLATGAISGETKSGFATATCKLCPTCPNCPTN